MDWLKNRRVVVFGGMGLALVAGLGIAAMIAANGAAPDEAPPASRGGLVVQTGRDDDIKLDPKRPLRCFVNGQFVGELPLSDCAQKNGVATGALDVGLDQSGALAAANGGGAHLTPLSSPTDPPAAAASTPADMGFPVGAADQKAVPVARKTAICWSYAGDQWARLPGELDLAACVRAVFAGHCATAGATQFGRWGERGLRLTSGKIELTSEDGDYRHLTTQTADCRVAPFGKPSQ